MKRLLVIPLMFFYGIALSAYNPFGTLLVRPDFDSSSTIGSGKPTQVTIGANNGFSLPIYNNDNEELFTQAVVPCRWDGKSNIVCEVIFALAGAEDVGDKFQLQLGWDSVEKSSDTLATVTQDVTYNGAVVTGRTAQYSVYTATFTINYTAIAGKPIVCRNLLDYRIRRIAAPATQISGELIVISSTLRFTVDKMFSGQ